MIQQLSKLDGTKLQARGQMKRLLKFFPNMVNLCARLLLDERVSKTEKALFASALIYAVTPLDFLPDFIPFIGQIDDAYLVALTVLRLVNKTDAAIVREHWKGKEDIIELADSIAGFAPLLMPKRASRILSSNIDFAPLVKRGKLLMQGKKQPVLIDDDAAMADEKKGVMRVVSE